MKISDCDDIQADFINFFNATICENIAEFFNFDKENMKLDVFLSPHLRTKYIKAWPCVQKLLLSNSQTRTEKSFSFNKKIDVENLEEKLYAALML